MKLMVPPPALSKVKVLPLRTVRLGAATLDWNSRVAPLPIRKFAAEVPVKSLTLVNRRVPPLIVVLPEFDPQDEWVDDDVRATNAGD